MHFGKISFSTEPHLSFIAGGICCSLVYGQNLNFTQNKFHKYILNRASSAVRATKLITLTWFLWCVKRARCESSDSSYRSKCQRRPWATWYAAEAGRRCHKWEIRGIEVWRPNFPCRVCQIPVVLKVKIDRFWISSVEGEGWNWVSIHLHHRGALGMWRNRMVICYNRKNWNSILDKITMNRIYS